ncbi:MAG: hypothetical protein RIF32_12995 [Leptospirales bacterium]
MKIGREDSTTPGEALADGTKLRKVFEPVHRRIDVLEKRLNRLNEIAAQANASIRAERFEDLPRYEGLLRELLRTSSAV